MQSLNSFILNLNQQKNIAKKRLKAIRNGELSAMAKVQKFHTHSIQINANNIKLADVQYALARELGLPSWSKLKQHIEELDHHRQAISDHVAPLDSDATTLHVRCGHDIQSKLRECRFEGEFLPLIDPLCIGPLPASQKDFVVRRAQYVHQTLLPIIGRAEEEIDCIIESETANLAKLLSEQYERIVFWVEHDCYDQLMLVYALTQLESAQKTTVEIIEVNQFPGTDRFIGFGQLPAEAIRSCWQKRKVVTPKLMIQATKCWQALISSQPSSLVDLLQSDSLDCLPNMSKALKRHLQELPNHSTGLSLTQTLAMQVLSNENVPITASSWFIKYQKKEPLPFLGDVMFYALLLPLAQGDTPLIKLTNQQSPWWEHLVSITEYGQACLISDIVYIQDYWVGGIHCKKTAQWQWDHQETNTLSVKSLIVTDS
ncbi:MAG: DUF1835 domain-containing protein [Colwellia sp.]|nr:DUF1835 domain-containing protein [Colwellia sp.]